MTIEIRPIRDDELPAYVDSVSSAFLERPDVDRVADEVRTSWDLARSWAALDGSRIVGTFRSWATELTVPGCARLPASAISAVTVLPTHRRRGILRSMVAREHAAARERGEAFGILHAAEYPIYGRFGYGPGTLAATWTVDARGSGFHAPAGGSVELAKPDAAARAELMRVFDAWRLRQPGEIGRRAIRWEYDLGRDTAWGQRWKGLLALHRDDAGVVDGYARYRPEDKWEQRQPRGTLTVDELHALTDDAYASLWQFLLTTDLVASVKAEGRTPTERLPWLLTNARAAVMSDVGEGLWVRLLDLPRALEARTYETAASLVLEIVEPEHAGGRATFRLDAGPDGARCTPTAASPDLTVNIAAIGAAYLGGSPLRDAVLPHGCDEHRAGALATADALFGTRRAPWCSTFF